MIAAAMALFMAALSVPAAQAGSDCQPRSSSARHIRSAFDMAARSAEQLDASNARVAFIARAGQDLSRYGLRYSHLGLVYRVPARSSIAATGAGANGSRAAASVLARTRTARQAQDSADVPATWRVVHKLNHCGAADAALYRQGLAQFFSEHPNEYRAAIVLLEPRAEAALYRLLQHEAHVLRMHQRDYNVVAYPWSTLYQQSNQWAVETLASAMRPRATERASAQAWLRARGYQPTELHINAMERLGGRITRANVQFDDHPFGLRMSGRIRTTTVKSVYEWLSRSGIGRERIEIVGAG